MLPVRPALRGLLLALGLTSALAACQEEEGAEAPELRPVRTTIVEESTGGETITLSGTVESQVEVDLAFRIGGRLVERLVGVGDTVAPGQVIARLDPADEENALRGAEAALAAAAAQLSEARSNYERQRQLFERDIVSRAGLERAEQAFTSAQSAYDAAEAQVGIARRRLADTVLEADAPGVVTAVGAEAGEVVSAGRRIVQLARDEGKDAVFDVPRPSCRRPRPIPRSRDAQPQPGRHRHRPRPRGRAARRCRDRHHPRARRPDRPARGDAARLHRHGRVHFGGSGGIEMPASALTTRRRRAGGLGRRPGDATRGAAPRRGRRASRPPRSASPTGSRSGERIVTAGVQALRPGQEVRLLGEGS
jgi:membrane fusion protein, multidrug efflux system